MTKRHLRSDTSFMPLPGFGESAITDDVQLLPEVLDEIAGHIAASVDMRDYDVVDVTGETARDQGHEQWALVTKVAATTEEDLAAPPETDRFALTPEQISRGLAHVIELREINAEQKRRRNWQLKRSR